MITLTLILFSISIGFGQDSTEVAVDTSIETETNSDYYLELPTREELEVELASEISHTSISTSEYKPYEHPQSILTLLYFYEVYEKECFNDSTRIETYEYETNSYPRTFMQCAVIGCLVGHATEGLMPSGFRWIHKEPTLKGFIEYLRRLNESKQVYGKN